MVVHVVRLELHRLFEVAHRVLHRSSLGHASQDRVRGHALDRAQARDLAVPDRAHVVGAGEVGIDLERAIRLRLDLAREGEPLPGPLL